MNIQHGDLNLSVADLASVVYSSGKVFDGLSTGRVDTTEFLRTGSRQGINTQFDLALLQDLRDVAQLIIDHASAHLPINAEFLMSINRSISRSGSLYPGELRRDEQNIGVRTIYGRHEPAALNKAELDALIVCSTGAENVSENAINLFLALAKAQPFGDGNKRTALFAANTLLIEARVGLLLTIPVDDENPEVAHQFNDKLARAYMMNEDEGIKAMLRDYGLKSLRTTAVHDAVTPDEPVLRERYAQLPGIGERPDLHPPTSTHAQPKRKPPIRHTSQRKQNNR